MLDNVNFTRPSWDQYFIDIARLTSERSNCIKRRVGCVIVKDKRILSLGYNGTPFNTLNCYQGGCKRCMDQYKQSDQITAKHLDLCMCLHAEENAILFVSKSDLKHSTIYITLIPCISCVKKILQCQIKRVVYIENYSPELDQIAIDILKSNNVEITKYNVEIAKSNI